MLIIAHRGASRAEPENTLRAFDLAIRQGAQMIELDLHLTGDGHIVVIHDAELDHTTDLTGRISEMSLDEVRRADAGKGERVPTLDETLDLTLGRVRLYLEIKDPRAADETLRMIRARNCRDDCMLASFDLPLMRRLGREVNDIELGVILGNETINPIVRWREAFPWLAMRDIRYDVLCMQVELCYGMLVRMMKASGKKVYVWTADDEKQFERLIGYEVDGIVTNVPDRLNDYLSKRGITPC